MLVAVLDTLVPADAGFPSGAVAVAHVLAVAAASASLGGTLERALQSIQETAGAAGFAMLPPEEREPLLRRVEAAEPEAFDALVRQTYDGYYSHPVVVARLGLDPGPLHPRGHRVESAESPDLARVSARGPRFRPA